MSCKTIYVQINSFLSEEEKQIVARMNWDISFSIETQLKMAPMKDVTLL